MFYINLNSLYDICAKRSITGKPLLHSNLFEVIFISMDEDTETDSVHLEIIKNKTNKDQNGRSRTSA